MRAPSLPPQARHSAPYARIKRTVVSCSRPPHNRGGPNADFGITYDVENRGPAPDNIKGKILALPRSYKVQKASPVDFSKLGDTTRLLRMLTHLLGIRTCIGCLATITWQLDFLTTLFSPRFPGRTANRVAGDAVL